MRRVSYTFQSVLAYQRIPVDKKGYSLHHEKISDGPEGEPGRRLLSYR